MARNKNTVWTLPDKEGHTYTSATLAVLMDIRDELQTLNRLLGCQNFIEVPRTLRAIRRNTAKPRTPKGSK